MAVYQFSALSGGQSISLSPSADRLNFDQSAIAAADIRVTAARSNVVITYLASGKDVTLLNVGVNQLAPSNITFANSIDGSGGAAAQLIATVQGGASVAATDITVI